jgi:hypothetical protein
MIPVLEGSTTGNNGASIPAKLGSVGCLYSRNKEKPPATLSCSSMVKSVNSLLFIFEPLITSLNIENTVIA